MNGLVLLSVFCYLILCGLIMNLLTCDNVIQRHFLNQSDSFYTIKLNCPINEWFGTFVCFLLFNSVWFNYEFIDLRQCNTKTLFESIRLFLYHQIKLRFT
eukprot:1072721_1